MALDSTDIILRRNKGTDLTVEEIDDNFENTRLFVNALEDFMDTVLDPATGNLKNDSVDSDAIQNAAVLGRHLNDSFLEPTGGMEFTSLPNHKLKLTSTFLDLPQELIDAVQEYGDEDQIIINSITVLNLSLLAAIETQRKLISPFGIMMFWYIEIRIPNGWRLCLGPDTLAGPGSSVGKFLDDAGVERSIPDYRGKTLIVYDDVDEDYHEVADEGGIMTIAGHTHPVNFESQGHPLSLDEMPGHSHGSLLLVTPAGVIDGGNDYSLSGGQTGGAGGGLEHTHTVSGTTDSFGGHDNRPRFKVAALIIFVGL